jgi:hypothetical protein
MSYTLSSLVLCDVTPCDTMWHPYKGWKELRLDGSQRHWPRWRPPAGPRHSWTAEHLRKFNERLTFQQISTHVNCQLTVNTFQIFQHIKHLTVLCTWTHLSNHAETWLWIHVILESFFDGWEAFVWRWLQALQGPHATKRKAEWWDRVGQNPRAKTRDLSRQLSQTVVRPFSYQIEKRLHGPHSPLIFVSSDLLSLLNKIQVQHHNRGCQGPTTKLFHSKVQNRPSWRPLSACTFFSFHTATVP